MKYTVHDRMRVRPPRKVNNPKAERKEPFKSALGYTPMDDGIKSDKNNIYRFNRILNYFLILTYNY